jgi:hypothetical protein
MSSKKGSRSSRWSSDWNSELSKKGTTAGGLAFSEFSGYEGWQVVSTGMDGNLIAAVVTNPVLIDAYRVGVPGNGTPSPTAPRWRRSITTHLRTQ